MDGNSKDVTRDDSTLFSTPEFVEVDPDDAGWNPVVNAFSEGGGRPICSNRPDICGSSDDIPLPREYGPNPNTFPVFIKSYY